MTGARAGSWTHVGYAQKLVFGTDTVDRLAPLLKEAGARRVLLVAGRNRLDSEAGGRVVKALGRALASTFDGVRPHVPTSALQQALRQATADDVDALVSFGGGSAIDLAKGVAFFAEQQAGMSGQAFNDRPMLAHIAVPTTYSGAEVTPFFGMTDEATRQRQGAAGPTLAPVAAVYDPTVTLDLPPRISAETGMTCLAHAIDAAASPARTPEAEAVAMACIERTLAALPAVVDQPDDLAARAAMLEAAALGGRCLQNAAPGLQHRLAQALGGRTGMAHGLAHAVLLAHSVRALPEGAQRALGRVLGDDPAGAVDRLREQVGLPARLSDCGVGDDDLDAAVRLAGDAGDVARTILDNAY